MSDAKTISDAQDDLLENLLGNLKDLGLDCKTVKGDKRVEPEYFLQTRTSDHKDTIYNQVLCEELRNSYNCKDTLTTRCKRRGIRYKSPIFKKILLNGRFLHDHKMHWGYAIKWKVGRWGWHITPFHPKRLPIFGGYGDGLQVDSFWRDDPAAIIADARRYIAENVEKVPLDHIGENIVFPDNNGGRGVGAIHEGYPRYRAVWESYEFGYSFREPYSVCEEWQDEWTERCYIK